MATPETVYSLRTTPRKGQAQQEKKEQYSASPYPPKPGYGLGQGLPLYGNEKGEGEEYRQRWRSKGAVLLAIFYCGKSGPLDFFLKHVLASVPYGHADEYLLCPASLWG